MELIHVTEKNISETGFFCYMSKKKSKGYQKKQEWLKKRFSEGMKLKILGNGERGMIEYIPGEYAWRPVHADGYMFIHCLWVVGKSKGKGYAKLLLNQCIDDAKKMKMKGVAMVTSEKVWLLSKKFMEKNGFESADHAMPSFELMVKKFSGSHSPSFTGNWAEKAKKIGNGLTVLHSAQCPYIHDAANIIKETAVELNIKYGEIELDDSQKIKHVSPSAYGTFGIVYNGKLLSYHYLTKKDLMKQLIGKSRKK